MRSNPKGVHFERWRHVHGCGRWFNLARDTVERPDPRGLPDGRAAAADRASAPADAQTRSRVGSGATSVMSDAPRSRIACRRRPDRPRAARSASPSTAPRYQGFAGDTLASALLANGVHLVGRSFKYHRPRGIFSAGAEEPNALVQLGAAARAPSPTCAPPRSSSTTASPRAARTAGHRSRFDLRRARATCSRPLFPAGLLLQDLHVAAVAGGTRVRAR